MEQIAKNTVSAQAQLSDNEWIRITEGDTEGVRIMLVGNSITLHRVAPEIGWYRLCGMAASEEEKDYVHILMRYVHQLDRGASFCVCQGSRWETEYPTGCDFYDMFQQAREFGADVIVIRLLENCACNDFDPLCFKQELLRFIQYLSGDKSPRVLLTTSFWYHIGDAAMRELAEEQRFPLVELGDLGELDEMKAVGLFSHEGVANHPGDKGMQQIADRIFAALKELL